MTTTATAICEDFRVIVDGRFVLDPALTASVDNIWSAAIAVNAQLFDGEVLVVKQVDARQVTCAIVPYRVVYAQNNCSEMAEMLDLRAVGVSGLVHTDGNILYGRRSSTVSQLSNKWELIPSGSLDISQLRGDNSVDFVAHTLLELEEEAGISPAQVRSCRPFLLVEDTIERVVDVCCVIAIDIETLKAAVVTARQEYEQVCIGEISDVKLSMKKHSSDWVPTSEILLEMFLKFFR